MKQCYIAHFLKAETPIDYRSRWDAWTQDSRKHSEYCLDSGFLFCGVWFGIVCLWVYLEFVVFFFPSVIPAGGVFASNKDKKSWGKNTTDHPENRLNFRTNGK